MIIRNFNLLYFCLVFIYEFINCQEIDLESQCKIKNNTNSIFYSLLSTKKKDLKSNINNNCNEKIINKEINIGKVQTEIFHNKITYIFNFKNNIDIKSEFLLVHFYSLDCHIEISVNEEDINIEYINNYEYGAFFAKIQKSQLDSIQFKIKPIIYSYNEYYRNKTYYLTINSFELNENEQSELLINEKNPTFLYFNNNLGMIKLLYELKEKPTEPIFFSVFIKEKVNFEFTVEVANLKNTKNIDYLDNIIITPDQLPNGYPCNIPILINQIEKEKNPTMIIKVISNYITPFYLQRNIINLGFMPHDSPEQYFYMEIFEGEEGQITLFNKKLNGKLSLNVVNKNDFDDNFYYEPQIYFQDNNKISKFNDLFDTFSQSINFFYSNISCTDKCYLLIKYESPKFKLENIIGTEFSLSIKIWDYEEFSPDIINIPLNEYIFGTFIDDYIIHYYSVYIPDNENIFLEIHGKNLLLYAYEGIKKMNIYKKIERKYYLSENEKIININEIFNLEESGNKYITFALVNSYYYDSKGNYYFRILNKKFDDDNLIYPLDTNKENVCQLSKYDKGISVCYFLLKNDYNELNYPSIIYTISPNFEKYVIYTVNLPFNAPISINNIKEQSEKSTFKNKYLTLEPKENVDFILLEIQTRTEINNYLLSLIYNFYSNDISFIFLNIYSSILFQLDDQNYNSKKVSFFVKSDQYKVFLNCIKGNGFICFGDDCTNDSNSQILENSILNFKLEEKTDIKFSITQNLTFIIKVNNEISYMPMNEMKLGNNIIIEKEDNNYPYIYYLKDLKFDGVDMNLYINFNENNINNNQHDLEIKGCTIDYDDIKKITSKDYNFEYILNNLFCQDIYLGKYDNVTKTGLIVFDKFRVINYNLLGNLYYLIYIQDYDFYNLNKLSISNIEINTSPKNNKDCILPMNKYIRGLFYSLDGQIKNQTFFVKILHGNENKNNTYILDFSSNYKKANIIFNENFTYDKKEIIGGIQRYYIKDLNINIIYNFTVEYNEDEEEEKEKEEDDNNNNYDFFDNIHYILKFYSYDDKDNEQNNIYYFDQKPILEKINSDQEKGTKYNLILEKKKDFTNLNDKYEYIYRLCIYSIKDIFKNQILDTSAYISQNYIFTRSGNYSPNEELKINLVNILSENSDYIISLFYLEKNKENKNENYYSFSYNITTKEENNNNTNKKSYKIKLYITIIAFSCFLILLIIIFIIIYMKIRKKNKKLQDEVNSISFSSGIINEPKNRTNSKIGDYETSFI